MTIIILLMLIIPIAGCCSPIDSEASSVNYDDAESLTVFFYPSDQNYTKFNIVKNKILMRYGIKVEPYPGISSFDDLTPEFMMKLSAEIMSGKGPDIFLFDSNEPFEDINKKMDAGVFYDLNDFINADDSFDINDYEQKIMDAGMYKGKRYIMPLSYNVPMLITTKEKLNSFGYDTADFSDFDRFISSWESVQRRKNISLIKLDHYVDWMGYAISYYGFLDECIDFEENQINLETPVFRKIMDIYKSDYIDAHSYIDSDISKVSSDFLFIFSGSVQRSLGEISNCERWDDIVILTHPNAFGSGAASIVDYCMISINCKNPDVAWDLVKMMLSDSVQNTLKSDSNFNRISVRKGSINRIIESSFIRNSVNGADNDEVIEMLTHIYNSYDNVVLPFFRGYKVAMCMEDYFMNVENYFMNYDGIDFDKLKDETKNYLNIWMSE